MAVFYVQGKELSFNGCKAVLGTPSECCEQTCDNSGRDIELVEISTLAPYVRAETAYKEDASYLFADQATIEQHLAWTLTDFTQKSGILRRKAKISIQSGLRDYYIEPPAGEKIYRVRSACVNGACMDSHSSEPCCTSGQCRSNRGGFVFHPQDKIVLDEAVCRECGFIEVQYESFVSSTACTVDKMIIDRYQRAIVAGAAGGIRKMAGLPWSLPAKGLDLEREFKLAIDRAKIEEAIGYANNTQMVNGWGQSCSDHYPHHWTR